MKILDKTEGSVRKKDVIFPVPSVSFRNDEYEGFDVFAKLSDLDVMATWLQNSVSSSLAILTHLKTMEKGFKT